MANISRKTSGVLPICDAQLPGVPRAPNYVDPPKKVPPTWDLEPQIGAAPHPGCRCGAEAPVWGGASPYGLGHPFAEAADLKRRDMSC